MLPGWKLGDVLTDIRAELESTSEKDADSMHFIKSSDPAP